ncbi:MAG: protein kinase [Chloroflexi bacterium]|nr:protein kinase [Chloroflexota bacterium]
MDNLVGKRIGQYIVQERIGEGGMATVYRGMQESIGREVAIKVIDSKLASQDSTWLDRFHREVQLAAQLPHPHIVPIYDYGQFEGTPYTVMALLEGGTLSDHIETAQQMPIDEALGILKQVGSALDFAHEQGILHRDLKPSNILFDQQGNAYLGDFGLARGTDSERLTASGSAMGTPAYMAPDWQQGDLTSAADIYSFGVILFEMLTGIVPYDGSNVMQVIMAHVNQPVPDIRLLRPDLPEGVQWVISSALSKAPSQRYSDARTMLNDLTLLIDDPQHTPTGSFTTLGVEQQFFYPNAYMRSTLLAAEEALGTEERNALLIQANLPQYIDALPPSNNNLNIPFEHVSSFIFAIYQVYGSRGARSVGRWAGKRSFFLGLSDFKALAKVSRAIVQRLNDDNAKLRAGIEFLAKWFNTLSDQRVEVDENEDFFIWRITRCPICWKQQADEPMGFLAVGVMEGACEWTTGKHYRVFEEKCVAKGDPFGEIMIAKHHSD